MAVIINALLFAFCVAVLVSRLVFGGTVWTLVVDATTTTFTGCMFIAVVAISARR